MFKKKKIEETGKAQTIKLGPDDCALILRGTGKSETVCTLKGKHNLTTQEEVVISLGGLLQNEKFVESIIGHFHVNMMKMINNKTAETFDTD